MNRALIAISKLGVVTRASARRSTQGTFGSESGRISMFNLVAPAITGNPSHAGNALIVSDGEWETGINGVVTHAYQWLCDGFPIADATDAKYTLRADDIGHAISCVVVTTDAAGGRALAESNVVIAGG